MDEAALVRQFLADLDDPAALAPEYIIAMILMDGEGIERIISSPDDLRDFAARHPRFAHTFKGRVLINEERLLRDWREHVAHVRERALWFLDRGPA